VREGQPPRPRGGTRFYCYPRAGHTRSHTCRSNNMRLEKCWFCSSTVYPGHGICFVRNDSKLFRFCRSKCHKNFKMKRNPRKVKWTKAYRAIHKKDLSDDSVFNFERRRNRPVRYNRGLTQKVLGALKTVEGIRVRRELRYYEERMKAVTDQKRRSDRRELQQQVHLVQAPSGEISGADRAKVSKGKTKVIVQKSEQNSGRKSYGYE